MDLDKLKAYLVVLKEQLLRMDGGVQVVLQLIQLAEAEAAKVAAEVKD